MFGKFIHCLLEEYKSRNAEIAAYKSLLYKLVDVTNSHIVSDYISNRLDKVLEQNKDLTTTTDVRTFLNNLVKDSE